MRTALLIMCLAFFGPPAGAQTIDRHASRESSILFEVLHPLYEGDDLEITSGAYILSGRVSLSRSAALLFDLPFAYVSFDDEGVFEDETSSSLGNPLIGVSFLSSNMEVQLGGRPGLADEEELATAVIRPADVMRREAFDPDIGTMFGCLRFKQSDNRELVWGFDLGATVWLPEEDEDEDEVFADYGVAAGYVGRSARLTMRLKGRALLTEDDLDFSERSNHQLGMFADFGSGRVRPGILALIHLDDGYEPDNTLGVSLRFMTH